MPTFSYEAMDSTGLEVKDTIEAPSEAEAQTKIREKGFYVTKIREPERKRRAQAARTPSRLLRKVINLILRGVNVR